MKKIKKITYIGLAIAVASLLFVNAGAISIVDTNKTLDMEITKIEETISMGGPIKTESRQTPLKLVDDGINSITMGTDIMVSFTEEDEANPSLAIGDDNTMLVFYEYKASILEQNIYMSSSVDVGQTWTDPGYFEIDGLESLPAIDYTGTIDGKQVFRGAFLSTEDSGAHSTIVKIDDVLDSETWGGSTWVWDDNGFYDFSSCDIVAYNNNIPLGNDLADYFTVAYVGSFSGIAGYPDCEQTPLYMVQTEEAQGWIFWFYYNHSANVKMDLDKPKEMIYYTFQWDNGEDQDVILLSSEMQYIGIVEGEGGWGDGKGEGRKYSIEGSANTINPAIAADNNYVYLIVQTDQNGNQDLVCYYSSDGGESYSMSVIADTNADEMYPAISANGQNAICMFTKNNNLYTAITENGGVSWEIIETPVNDVDGSIIEQYGCADVEGGYGVWTDDRNDDEDIYFDELKTMPIITITGISGGFGVSAEIENVGTADATNVQWSIDLEGGLVIVGKHADGTIPTLAAGASQTVKIGFVFGFGGVTITAAAGGATKIASGTVLGPFVIGVS